MLSQRYLFRSIFLTLLFIVLQPVYAGQNLAKVNWISMGGPYAGGRIDTLATLPSDSNTVYAYMSNGGLYKTVDAGKHWHYSGLREIKDVDKIVFAGENVYVLARSSSIIYCSVDGGKSWVKCNGGLPKADTAIQALYSDGKYVYTSVTSHSISNIFRLSSLQSGWKKIMTLPSDCGAVSDVIVQGEIVYACDGSVFRSFDNGKSWIVINKGLPAKPEIRKLFIYHGTLYGLNGNRLKDQGELYISHDPMDRHGIWKLSSNVIGTSSTANDITAYGNTIYLALGNYESSSSPRGVFKSVDNGVNWKIINTGFITTNTRAILATKSGVYAGSDAFGVCKKNSDDSWDYINKGIMGIISSVFTTKDGIVYAGLQNGQIYRKVPGSIWTNVSTGVSLGNNIIFGVKQLMQTLDGTMFAVVDGRLYRSYDGKSWSALVTPHPYFPAPQIYYASIAGASRIYISVAELDLFSPIYYSDDGGDNWQLVGGRYNVEAFGGDIQGLATIQNTVYVSSPFGLYRNMINGGGFWQNISRNANGLPKSYTGPMLAVDNGSQNEIFTVSYSSGSVDNSGNYGGLYSSQDGGQNWELLDNGMPHNLRLSSLYFVSGKIFTSSNKGELFSSSDFGKSWQDLGAPNVSGLVSNETTVSGNNAYMATNYGVYWGLLP